MGLPHTCIYHDRSRNWCCRYGCCVSREPLVDVLSNKLALEGQCLCLVDHTLVDGWRLSVHDYMTLWIKIKHTTFPQSDIAVGAPL